MSKQVDERVVSMQFDNKQFESNVKTSMSTIDKLKAKLDFKGASKGLENIDSAAKKVNMSGLGAGVEAVSAKFSALQVMGVTALANITNSAVNAGKRIVSALTIDPVKTGFQEYETQINAVQTILANTESKGSTIDDVNQALEELNKYADMTIYNFTEMTRNIGTFTAAGVDLDTSTNAIKGIANLAAVSGSTSQQASTAMYQLSQALASGTVKLMDWNSVVNAGMGGQVFQDALKETARVHGVAIDEMIESEGSFRETLKDGWITSEILTETLQKFTLTTDGLTESQIEANREMLRAKGYTEEQIEGIFKLGRTATDAATKVKTFTQLFDVLKEAAQSGWAQTWKIIVGDFEEAKALFTPLADMLTGFINKMSDARNNFLNAVLYPWKAIEDKLNGAGLGKIKKTIESVTDLSKTLEYYQQVMHDVWMGNYKNSDTGRYGLLDAAGHDHRVIQDLVNLSDTYYKGQGYKYQLTIEDVQNSQRKFGVAVSESSETVVEMTEVLENLTDEQLKNAGLTEEEIKLYRMLADEANRTGKPITELIKRMSEVDGRTLLINSLKNAGDVLVGTFKAIGIAWGEIFDPPSIVRAYSVLDAIHEFSKKLRLTDENTGELNENGQKLMRTLKGVFAVVDIVTTILGGGFKIAFKVVTTLLGMFNLNILDFTALVGDALVAVHDWLEGLFDIEGLIESIKPYIEKLGKAIKNAFSKVKEYIGPATEKAKEWFVAFKDSHILPFLERLGKGLKNTFGKIANVFKPAIEGVKNWFKSLRKSDNLAYDIIVGIANALASGMKFIVEAISILASDGWAGLKSLFNGKEGEGVGGNLISGLAKGIKDGAKIVWDALIELASTLMEKFKDVLGIHSPSTKFIAIGGFIVAGLLLGLKAAFPEVWETIAGFGKKCVEAIGGIDVGAVLALVTMLGTLFVANKFATALKNFSEPFGEFGEALERVSKGAKNYMNAKAFQELAKAIAILVGCIVVLTFVDSEKMWGAVWAIATMMGLFAALIGLVSFISKKQVDLKSALDFGKISLLLVSVAGSMLLIAWAMKLLSGIDEAAFDQAVDAVLLVGLIIGALIWSSKLAGPSVAGIGTMFLGIAGALIAVAFVIKTISGIPEEDLEKGIKTLWWFAGIIAALMVATWLIGRGKNVDKIGGSIFKIAAAIGILALVVLALKGLSEEELNKGIDAIRAFGFVIAGLMLATKLITGSKNVDKIGGAIFKIAAAIALMALVVVILKYVDQEDIDRGIDAIAGFAVIIAGLMYATKLAGGKKGAAELGKAILSIAGAIAILAIVAVLLGLVKEETLKRGITAVTALAGIVAVLVLVSKNAKNAKFAYLIVLTAAIIALAGVAIALTFLDQDKLRSAAISMGILMGVFALLIKVTNSLKAGKGWGKAMITLGILTGVVAALGLVLFMLGKVNPENSRGNALALGMLIGILTGVSYAIVKMSQTMKTGKKATKNLYTFLGVMGALTLVIGALALILWMMKDVSGKDAIGSAVALGVLIAVLAGAVILLSKFPADFKNVFAAAAAMGVLALALFLIAPALNLFGSMSWGEIIKGLAAVAGVFVVFGLAGYLLGPVAAIISTLATATLAFGAGIALLGVGVLAAAAGIYILAQALKVGGDSLVDFISNLIDLLPSLFASIGDAIGAFAMSIMMAAPLIGAALKILVLTAIDVLVTCIPAIVEGIFTLIIETLNKLIEYLPQVVPLLVKLFVTLVDLVIEHLPTILDAVVRLLVALLTGISSRIGELIQPIVDLLVALVQGAADIIGPIFEAVIEPVLTILKDLLVGLFEAIGPYLPDIIAAFKDFTQVVCDAIVKIVEVLAPYIPEITALLEVIVNAFIALAQEISPIIDSIAGLIEKLGDAIDKILQRIDGILQTIGSTITDWLNEFKGIIEAVGEAVDKSLDGIAGVFDSAFGGIADVIDSVGNGVKKFLDGISGVIDSVGEAALNAGKGFEKLANGVKTITDLKLADMTLSLTGVANGLGKITKHADGLSKSGDGMKKIADGVKLSEESFNRISAGVGIIIESLETMGPAASDASSAVNSALNVMVFDLAKIAVGVTEQTGNVVKSVGTMGSACVKTIFSFMGQMSLAGKYLITGLAAGIRANKSAATTAAREVADAVEDIIRDAWQVNSPSKLFYGIALGVGEGMRNAFGDSISGVKRSADELANSAVGGFSDTVSMIAEAINADLDAEPTIRPVFDLTDLKSGAATINGMLNGNRTLSVDTATIGSLSASMSKLQNGNNSSELLSAIRGLRKDVANNPRNSYSINGITVEEGSDAAEAIGALVRAIKVEGRT